MSFRYLTSVVAIMTVTGLVVLVPKFATPAAASPLEDAQSAFFRGDFATAVQLCRPLADGGDAFPQTMLGETYYQGQGVPQDYTEAMRWFRKAAQQGNPFAQIAEAQKLASEWKPTPTPAR